jgi:MFS family permease
MSRNVFTRNDGLAPFLVSRFAYVMGAAGAPVLLTLTTLERGGSLTSLAFVLGAGALPSVFGALISKRISDRITTRGLLLWTTLAWVLTAAITATLGLLDAQTVVWLCVVSFVIELSAALQYPSLGSYLPRLVREEDLERANSARSFTVGIAGIVGPAAFALAGTVVPTWVGWIALAGMLALSSIPLSRLPRGEAVTVDDSGVWGELRDGWSYFWSSRGIWVVVVVSGVWHFFGWSILTVTGPVILRDGYDNVAAWGWLQSALAAGSLLGALAAARLRTTRVARWALVSLCPALVLGVLLSFRTGIAWVLVMAALTGAAMAAGGVLWHSAIQREVPADRLGQVFGFDYLFSEAINPIGLLFVPVLAGVIGGQETLLTYASTMLLAVVLVAAILAPRGLTPTSSGRADDAPPPARRS